MVWDIKKELVRKTFHFLAIVVFLIYFLVTYWFDRQMALIVLVVFLIILLTLEYFRVDLQKKVPIFHHIYKFRRDNECDRIGSDVYLVIGAIIALAIFDIRVAVAAILITIFGDMAACLFGKCVGKNKLKGFIDRTWEGVYAQLIVDIIIVFLVFFWGFWSDFSLLYNLEFWIIVFVMSISATFIETIVYKIDDNLFIPILSGFLGEIILMIFNYVRL